MKGMTLSAPFGLSSTLSFQDCPAPTEEEDEGSQAPGNCAQETLEGKAGWLLPPLARPQQRCEKSDI